MRNVGRQVFMRETCHASRRFPAQFVDQVKASLSQFVTGDVTIFGGWGAYEQGWEQVGPRLDWAAERFRGGAVACELLAQGIGGDLAYTAWLERGQVRVAGRDELSPMILRV